MVLQDRRSLMAVVSQDGFHCNIFQVLGALLNTEQMQDDYEVLTSALIEWIKAKIQDLDDHNFPNSLDGIQAEVQKFKLYRTKEKPPK